MGTGAHLYTHIHHVPLFVLLELLLTNSSPVLSSFPEYVNPIVIFQVQGHSRWFLEFQVLPLGILGNTVSKICPKPHLQGCAPLDTSAQKCFLKTELWAQISWGKCYMLSVLFLVSHLTQAQRGLWEILKVENSVSLCYCFQYLFDLNYCFPPVECLEYFSELLSHRTGNRSASFKHSLKMCC